jgi:hypothetical protein
MPNGYINPEIITADAYFWSSEQNKGSMNSM